MTETTIEYNFAELINSKYYRFIIMIIYYQSFILSFSVYNKNRNRALNNKKVQLKSKRLNK